MSETGGTVPSEFEPFFMEHEPRLRRALVAHYGPIRGREAAAAPLPWASAPGAQGAPVPNPTPLDQPLSVDYLLKSGPPITIPYTMPASGRLTIDVNHDVGPNQEVAAHIRSGPGALFVAERPMYFSYLGKWTGGHDVVGVPAPGTTTTGNTP